VVLTIRPISTMKGFLLMKMYNNNPDEITEEKVLRRVFDNSVAKAIDAEKRHIDFIISTSATDRYRDVVDVSGWDLKAYRKNPVVLFGHMGSIPPIGKAFNVRRDGDALKATAEFMPQDISAFAHSIFRMYQEGYLRAVSVGFRPLKWEWITDESGDPTGGIHFKRQELLEFSAVPVPANPEALMEARSKGIDTLPIKSWAEEMLDNWNNTADDLADLYGVDRKKMEAIRRRAAGAGASIRVPIDLQDEIMRRNLEAIRAQKAAKQKQQTLESVQLRHIDMELPMMTAKEAANAGTIEISKDESGAVSINKADNTVLIDPVLINDDHEYMDVELRRVDDGTDALVLTVKGENIVVEYDVMGVTDSGTLYAMKMGEAAVEGAAEATSAEKTAPSADDEEDEEKKTSGDAEADEEEKSSDEDEDKASDDDDDDDADEGDKPDDSDDDPEDENDPEDDDDDDDDKPKGKQAERSLGESLSVLEGFLLDFEEQLDKNTDSLTRHQKRKQAFLAGMMRELADRLDGGIKATQPQKSVTAAEEEEEISMSVEEAERYQKELIANLQPVLTEIIQTRVNKMRGRLD